MWRGGEEGRRVGGEDGRRGGGEEGRRELLLPHSAFFYLFLASVGKLFCRDHGAYFIQRDRDLRTTYICSKRFILRFSFSIYIQYLRAQVLYRIYLLKYFLLNDMYEYTVVE